MLNLEQIEKVVAMVATSRLVEVDIQSGTQRLRIKNSQSATPYSNDIAGTNSTLAHTIVPAPTLPTVKPKQITSNYIGKVQLAADSVIPVFKKMGDSVTIGETVAVVAQLGRLLPVKSEQVGVIKEILIENNQRVEYGTPLFSLA